MFSSNQHFPSPRLIVFSLIERISRTILINTLDCIHLFSLEPGFLLISLFCVCDYNPLFFCLLFYHFIPKASPKD